VLTLRLHPLAPAFVFNQLGDFERCICGPVSPQRQTKPPVISGMSVQAPPQPCCASGSIQEPFVFRFVAE
jgi:hypothetical protein